MGELPGQIFALLHGTSLRFFTAILNTKKVSFES